PTRPTNALSLPCQDQPTPIYPSSTTGAVQCGDGIGIDPAPCNNFAMNRNFRTPNVINWAMRVQHAFSGKLGLDVSYVGNHGVKLPGVVDLNQPAVGSGWTPAAIAAGAADGGAEAAAHPHTLNGTAPYLALINYLSNFYGSTYHGF